MRLQMIIFMLLLCLTKSIGAIAMTCIESYNSPKKKIFLDRHILNNNSLDFIEHLGPFDDPYGSSLAMNVPYDPIIELRHQIESLLNLDKPLKFFTGWNSKGEAHVTTITPIEYFRKIKDFVDISRINQIAREFNIQTSDLTILGLGKGQLIIEGKTEATYFAIVKSDNLLRIRRAIYQEFLKKGGTPKTWNPDIFYPHITIGYTLRDLHESDGVLKDLEHSQDKQFEICYSTH